MKTTMQTGFATLYIVAAVVLLAAVVGWGEYRHGQGVIKERTKNLNAVFEHEAKMSATRREHDAEIEALAKKHNAENIKQTERIRALLQTNKTLSDWWNTPVAPDAVPFIWMQPTSDNQVRGRPRTASADPVAGSS